MHVRLLRSMSQTCLGRQGPEGGVVLGLHPDYDDFPDIYIFMSYSKYYIILICLYLCMHPLF